jgi:YggT family protein
VFIAIYLLNAARLLVVADAVLSWLQKPNEFPRSITKPLLDPIYAPVRRVLLPIAPSVDLAPLVALLVLYVVQKMLESARVRDRA